MAKKAREGKREKREPAEKPDCDLEGPAPSPGAAGLSGILRSVRSSRYLQILVVLTLAGAFLRLFQIGTASLWLDEASTLTYARESVTQIWGSLSGGEFNPPLFYWLEHFMLAFGEGETVLRLVPAILGILTIPVFYLIGREILDRNTGILAAALLTFSPFHIFYSQEARAYAPMLFFYAIAFLFFLRFLRSWGKRDALLFGIFSALAFWTHFYAFVPILTLFVFAVAVKARGILRDIRSAVPLAAAILAFIILSAPLIYYAIQLFGARTGGPPSFGIQGIDTITLTITQVSGFSSLLTWVFAALFIVGVAWLFPRDRTRACLLAFSLAFPLVLSVILSYRMPMVPRYLIYLLAAFLPGIALALRPACSFIRTKNLVYGALILSLVINLPVLVPYYTTVQKDDWRGLSAQLTTAASPGDLVIVTPGYLTQPLDYYYHNGTVGTLEYGLYTIAEVEGALGAHPGHTAWIIVTGDILSTDPRGLLLAWYDQHTESVWVDRNRGIFLLRYTG